MLTRRVTAEDTNGSGGNDYAGFRFDNCRHGRFTSPDPLSGNIFNPQRLNRYTYVKNDPINGADLVGLDDDRFVCTADTCVYVTDDSISFGGPVGPMVQLLRAWRGMQGLVELNADHWTPRGGGGGGGLDVAGVLADAVERAVNRLDKEECARIFRTLNPATALLAACSNNQIRAVPFGDYISPGVGAQTNTNIDVIYLATNRYFFTGQFNGGPVTQTALEFRGLSQSQVQEVILIHELLHLTRSVDADNANQEITLGNAEVVRGSAGVTAAIREHCIR